MLDMFSWRECGLTKGNYSNRKGKSQMVADTSEVKEAKLTA